MTEQMKAQMYGELLNQHTKLSNQISEIKGQSLELNQQQQNEVRNLQNQQIRIMESIKRLLN